MTAYDDSPPPLARPVFPPITLREDPPKILALYGSLRERSYSRLLAEEGARILEGLGCEVRLFDPRELPMKGPGLDDHPKVQELRALPAPSGRGYHPGHLPHCVGEGVGPDGASFDSGRMSHPGTRDAPLSCGQALLGAGVWICRLLPAPCALEPPSAGAGATRVPRCGIRALSKEPPKGGDALPYAVGEVAGVVTPAGGGRAGEAAVRGREAERGEVGEAVIE
jgi:hypothetical protein